MMPRQLLILFASLACFFNIQAFANPGDLAWELSYFSPCQGPILSKPDPLHEAYEVVVSGDGKGVFVTAKEANTLVVYDRDLKSGKLAFNDCFVDKETANACCQSTPALDGARSVAVSGDGMFVYAVSARDNAVVTFSRDPSNNHLTYLGCVQDVDRAAFPECGPAKAQRSGLSGNRHIMISKDDLSVYVAGRDDDAVTVFSRNKIGGLAWVGCITDGTTPTSDPGCVTAPGAIALDETHAVVLSPDDRFLYVASAADHAVNTFERDSSTGAVSYRGCVADEGLGLCGANTNRGLHGARSIVVSQDGLTVYVAGTTDKAIAILKRDRKTGQLLPTNECVKDDTSGEICQTQSNSLREVHFVAVSSDPASSTLYAVGRSDDAIVAFDRDKYTALLSNPRCYGSNAPCAWADGMNGATSIAVAPPDPLNPLLQSLYLVSRFSNSLVWFDIE